MSDKRSLDLIQVLRGIASLLVVLMHTTNLVKEKFGHSFLGGFFTFGDAGVDIFFVLSGFIITYVNKKSLNNPANFPIFLKRRFIRIFPAYWIIITVFLLLQVVLPSFYRTHFEFSIHNLSYIYLLLPGHIMVNGVSWTLTYELFFYFLFSLAFLIRNRIVRLILSIGYVLLLIALPISGHVVTSPHGWDKLPIFPMIVEFFMGIMAALMIPKMPGKLSIPFIFLGSVLLLAAGLFTDNGFYLLKKNYFNIVLLYGLPSFFIITGIVRYELDNRIKVPRILLWLGEASYSLYLIHLPIVAAGIIIIGRFGLRSALAVHLAAFVLIAMICMASILFFKWIERPIIDKLNKIKI